MYQELNDGYQRNPIVFSVLGITGSALAPIKIHTPRGYIGRNIDEFCKILNFIFFN